MLAFFVIPTSFPVLVRYRQKRTVHLLMAETAMVASVVKGLSDFSCYVFSIDLDGLPTSITKTVCNALPVKLTPWRPPLHPPTRNLKRAVEPEPGCSGRQTAPESARSGRAMPAPCLPGKRGRWGRVERTTFPPFPASGWQSAERGRCRPPPTKEPAAPPIRSERVVLTDIFVSRAG
jgi:hypothetical protein